MEFAAGSTKPEYGEWTRVKSSTEAASPANDPAVGALSGDPAATIPAQASGLAGWLQEPQERSATGHRAASPAGQFSWALFEWARNPYVLLVTIYLFAPYFSRTVVGDPVRGQAIWGTIAAVGGLVVALLAPFLGAIADAGGKRKPWIGFYVVILATSSLLMWFAMPHSSGWQLVFVGALVVLANTSFEFTQVFHNSLLPTIAPPRRIELFQLLRHSQTSPSLFRSYFGSTPVWVRYASSCGANARANATVRCVGSHFTICPSTMGSQIG